MVIKMVDKDELVLKILKKAGLSEKEVWSMIKNNMAKGISEDGAIKMLASKYGIFYHDEKKSIAKPSKISVPEKIKYEEMNIYSLSEGDKGIVRAAIMQVFESDRIFFYACPSCGKSVKGEYCPTHKTAIPQLSMKLSCVLDDGTGNIRALLFNNASQKILGMSGEDAKVIYDKDGVKALIEKIPLGEDFIFIGKVSLNSFFGKNELVVSNVKNVSVLEEIERIEKLIRGVGLDERG